MSRRGAPGWLPPPPSCAPDPRCPQARISGGGADPPRPTAAVARPLLGRWQRALSVLRCGRPSLSRGGPSRSGAARPAPCCGSPAWSPSFLEPRRPHQSEQRRRGPPFPVLLRRGLVPSSHEPLRPRQAWSGTYIWQLGASAPRLPSRPGVGELRLWWRRHVVTRSLPRRLVPWMAPSALLSTRPRTGDGSFPIPAGRCSLSRRLCLPRSPASAPWGLSMTAPCRRCPPRRPSPSSRGRPQAQGSRGARRRGRTAQVRSEPIPPSTPLPMNHESGFRTVFMLRE